MSDQKFNINEFGEIHRPSHTKNDDLESSEYSILQYEIFSHPERFTATELEQKKKRLAELEQKFGKQDDSALTKMRIKLKQKKQRMMLLLWFIMEAMSIIIYQAPDCKKHSDSSLIWVQMLLWDITPIAIAV